MVGLSSKNQRRMTKEVEIIYKVSYYDSPEIQVGMGRRMRPIHWRALRIKELF